jgi:triosephosphate isomerase
MTSPRRRPLVAGNWKMHRTGPEAVELIHQLRDGYTAGRAEVMVAPPFTALEAASRALDGSGIALGAQNVHWEAQGAFTGEISAGMLKAVGCTYVIVGHSERRQLFGELDAAVNLKAGAALRAGLAPIICVGETLAERDAGETIGRVQAQLDAALMGIDEASLERVVIAYEPVWAIGTGRNATPAQAQEVHHFIRSRIASSAAAVAPRLRILYGGSVKPDNIRALMAEPDVDGGLVGGASLSAESFVRLVKEGSTP